VSIVAKNSYPAKITRIKLNSKNLNLKKRSVWVKKKKKLCVSLKSKKKPQTIVWEPIESLNLEPGFLPSLKKLKSKIRINHLKVILKVSDESIKKMAAKSLKKILKWSKMPKFLYIFNLDPRFFTGTPSKPKKKLKFKRK
jgi:hypothetical protein